MMGTKERNFQPLPEDISLEDLVPEDNFYRRLQQQLDLSFVRDLVENLYAASGRPSIDPEVFFRLQLVMFHEGIRSERELMRIVSDRLSVRWYVGYDLFETLPHHSSLTRIRDRFGLSVFREFFERIVQLCVEAGLVGSLLSMVESCALMVAEVFRYDQTLPCEPGSRPTRRLCPVLRCPLRRPTPRFQALHGRFALTRRTQQDFVTALANTEPVAGAQRKEAQSLHWFLSESRWDPEELNARRLELLRQAPRTAPTEDGVLVIDEHGDRKWGKHTAHVGRQWLANIGKTESGVVSVSSLWADEKIYWPVAFEPYTPAHHFEGGKEDPKFRTKLKIAAQLVELSVQEEGIPFRAVVADSFYGEDESFKQSLSELGVGYVMALKPSHAWWYRVGEIGSPYEAALAAGWEDEHQPGDWEKVVRRFRDGHQESWWALEVDVGPYGPQRSRRAVVGTTDPEELPDKATWYLVTNLPHPQCSERANNSELEAVDLAEVVRLYGLRMWVEQSYKHVKHVLGWSDYQVRSDLAIRRHWELVCCAFSFCWWAYGRLPTEKMAEKTDDDPPADSEEGGKRRPGASWPQTLRAVRGWLEPYVMLNRYWRAFSEKPPPPRLKALFERAFSGRGLYLYVH